MPGHDDPDRYTWEQLAWLASQGIDVGDQKRALMDRRAAEEQAYQELTEPLAEPRTAAVAFGGAPTLAERLEGAHRVRIDTSA